MKEGKTMKQQRFPKDFLCALHAFGRVEQLQTFNMKVEEAY